MVLFYVILNKQPLQIIALWLQQSFAHESNLQPLNLHNDSIQYYTEKNQ